MWSDAVPMPARAPEARAATKRPEVRLPCKRGPRLSVIIPALNEAAWIAAAVESARAEPGAEVLVADGGSRDGTAERAAERGARVIRSALGRATQMNAGAAAASGEILLFLHADTRLPAEYAARVEACLHAPGVALGAFELNVDAPGRAYRWLEHLVNVRARRFQLPYGDQALFLHAETFRRLGGFPEVPVMEDAELVLRARRLGRVALAPCAVKTAARRWRQLGLARATLLNQACLWAWLLGVSTHRIACWRGRW